MLPKFKTAKQREKIERKTKRIFSLVIVLILFSSVFGFALYYSRGGTKQGKFTFTKKGSEWRTTINGYVIATSYLPKEVEDISHSGILNKKDFESVVYFVAESESEIKAANELSRILFAQKKEFACLPENKDHEECKNLTSKNCDDATFMQKIIIFQEEQEDIAPQINYKDNCLIIKGNSFDLIRATDKLIFLMYDIIE